MTVEAYLDEDGDIVLPQELGNLVSWQLHCLNKWPKAAQDVIDELQGVWIFTVDQEEEVTDNAVERAIDEPPILEGVPVWLLVVSLVGAAVVFGAAGYGIAKVK